MPFIGLYIAFVHLCQEKCHRLPAQKIQRAVFRLGRIVFKDTDGSCADKFPGHYGQAFYGLSRMGDLPVFREQLFGCRAG